MNRFLLIFTLLILTAGTLKPAYGQTPDITQDGADQLKTLIQNIIEPEGKNTPQNLIFDGEIIVEPAETFYAVTLPVLQIKLNDKKTLHIGLISMNVSPHAQTGEWAVRAALPTPLTIQGQAGQTIMTIDIGAQTATGIWHEELNAFMKLDARYQDVTARNENTDLQITTPGIEILYDLTRDDTNLWSGPLNFLIKNPLLEIAEDGTKISFDRLQAAFALEQYDPGIFQDYRETMQSAAQDQQALFQSLLQIALSAADGLHAKYSFDGFQASLPGATGTQTISLPGASLEIGIRGLFQNTTTYHAKAKYEGLSLGPQKDDATSLLPSDINLDLKLENLPTGQLGALIGNTLQGAASQPALGNIALLGLAAKLPAILATADTKLAISNNFARHSEYEIEWNGTVSADVTSLFGIIADMQIVFYNLDNLMNKANALMAINPQLQESGLGTVTKTVKTIKIFAKHETNEVNTPTHVFNLSLTPQGQFLINDQDISLLFTTGAGLPTAQ